MLAIRQELRPVVGVFVVGRIQGGQLHGPASGGGYPIEPPVYAAEYDHPFAAPGSAAPESRIADDLRRASGYLDLLELVAGEESQLAAVGRPEGIVGVLCS